MKLHDGLLSKVSVKNQSSQKQSKQNKIPLTEPLRASNVIHHRETLPGSDLDQQKAARARAANNNPALSSSATYQERKKKGIFFFIL